MEDIQANLMYPSYMFNFTRTVNGVPFYNNNVSVEVNRETGEIQSYQCNWTDDLVFPSVDTSIPMEQAQKMYRDNIGLKLVYNYTVDGENLKIFPAYVPKYSSNYCIDALSGERLEINPVYSGLNYEKSALDQTAMSRKAGGKGESISITPEERKAIEKVSRLITQDEAEKIARDFKLLGLTDDFKVSYLNLNRDWPDRDDYVWYINFAKEAQKDAAKKNASVSVTLNAMTGEIKRFYTYEAPVQTGEGKYDEAASKAAVESFLKSFKPDKYRDTEADDTTNNTYLRDMGKILQRQYTFRYVRKVNGIPFSGNYMSVTYDAVEGKVVGFDLIWFETNFPSLEKAAPVETAYEKLFSDVGLVLQYKAQYTNEASAKILPPRSPNAKSEIRLVYAPKLGKPLTIDAFTGVLLNYNGEPYKEIKPVVYSDISGNFAEKQIAVLAEYGISLEGDKFKPEEAITQKDYLTLLSKTLYNYGPVYPVSDTGKETEQLYRNLVREGVVKEGEMSPESAITREEGVKFIIRALKYDKVADIKGIFKVDFKDMESINPDLTGYVAIAQGLGIVAGNEGYFKPKMNLSRAEAAVMIFNYLQKQ